MAQAPRKVPDEGWPMVVRGAGSEARLSSTRPLRPPIHGVGEPHHWAGDGILEAPGSGSCHHFHARGQL